MNGVQASAHQTAGSAEYDQQENRETESHPGLPFQNRPAENRALHGHKKRRSEGGRFLPEKSKSPVPHDDFSDGEVLLDLYPSMDLTANTRDQSMIEDQDVLNAVQDFPSFEELRNKVYDEFGGSPPMDDEAFQGFDVHGLPGAAMDDDMVLDPNAVFDPGAVLKGDLNLDPLSRKSAFENTAILRVVSQFTSNAPSAGHVGSSASKQRVDVPYQQGLYDWQLEPPNLETGRNIWFPQTMVPQSGISNSSDHLAFPHGVDVPRTQSTQSAPHNSNGQSQACTGSEDNPIVIPDAQREEENQPGRHPRWKQYELPRTTSPAANMRSLGPSFAERRANGSPS